MSQDNEGFVDLMLSKAGKKEEIQPIKPLSPKKDKNPEPQRTMSEEDMLAVEQFTAELRKKMQQ